MKRVQVLSDRVLDIHSPEDPPFVAAMEDVLEVYKRPINPLRPVVCMNEQPKQIIGESRQPLPGSPASRLGTITSTCGWARRRSSCSSLPQLLAPDGSAGDKNAAGLGARGQDLGGRGFPQRGAHRADDGQLEQARYCLNLRRVSA